MENNYCWIQINHIHKLHSKKNGIDNKGKCDSVLELILNNLKICFAVSRKALNFFQVNFSSVFDVGVFLLAFIMASQCWCIILITSMLFQKHIFLKIYHLISGNSESAKGMVHPHQQRAKIRFQQKSCPVPCII